MGALVLSLALAFADPSGGVEDAKSRYERAELVAARARCAACHEADGVTRVAPEPAPSLERIGARKTPAGLRRWLADPHGAKPGTSMPDLLAALAPDDREVALDELVHYLAAQGGPLQLDSAHIDAGELERGRQLFHSVGCAACHTPQEAAEDLEHPLWSFPLDQVIAPAIAADLGNPIFDTSLDALAAFLRDPLATRPSGRMPSLALTDDEARAIALYLLRGSIEPESIEERPGLRWRYFEGHFQRSLPGFEGARVVEQGTSSDLSRLPPQHREEEFAFELSGFVDAPVEGTYEFATRSDDGSRLYVDGKLVVDNDGDHAPAEERASVHLPAGRHALVVTMYENHGGEELSVRWKPPGGEDEIVPADALSHWIVRFEPENEAFALDDAKVARGRERFRTLGCGACHELEGRALEPLRATPLRDLSPRSKPGCLERDARVRFALSPYEREALSALLGDAATLAKPRTPAERLHSTLARLDCFACHARDGEGGPNAERVAFFKPSVEADLGNEGRLPPRLDGVGAKLREPWTHKVLAEGANARPYLATRMPQFGAANVAELAGLFREIDMADQSEIELPFDGAQVELGRRLAGTKGLACIQCHRFNGAESLGIPAVDLAHVTERIQAQWFVRLLEDPKSVGLNSRMPEMWQRVQNGSSVALKSPITDILGGDPRAQIVALWNYLSLGSSMPLPDGLVVPDGEFELVPRDGPEMCAVFLEGASARGMMVGLPGGVNYAFDVENSRLVWAWRGRFFNAKGTWNGRAGHLERPPVADAIEFPKLAPIAFLPNRDAPWPTELGRAAGYRRIGWGLMSGELPAFRYGLGKLEVLEYLNPRAGGVARILKFKGSGHRPDLFVLLAAGKSIEPLAENWWSIDGRWRVRTPFADVAPFLVHGPDRIELRLEIPFGSNDVIEELAW